MADRMLLVVALAALALRPAPALPAQLAAGQQPGAAPLNGPANPASRPKATWVVRGVGSDSCGKFLAAVENMPPGKGATLNYDGNTWFDKDEVYAEWIQGYITAVNLMQVFFPHPTKQIDVDYPGTELWIRDWCEARPANSLLAAVSAFVRSQFGSQWPN